MILSSAKDSEPIELKNCREVFNIWGLRMGLIAFQEFITAPPHGSSKLQYCIEIDLFVGYHGNSKFYFQNTGDC